MTTTAEETNQITPIAFSLTWAVFFANGGRSSLIDRDAGADEDHVEKDVGDEDAVPHDVRVAAGLRLRRDGARRRYEPQHDDEDEEGHGVQQEQKGERLGWSVRAMAPATRPPSAKPRFIVMRCCANAA